MKKENVELPQLKGTDREKCIPIAIIIGLVVLIFIGILAFFSLTFKKTYTLHYNESSNLDYKVYLKPNRYYSVPYLPKTDDGVYVSSLIDNLDTTFTYEFVSAADIALEYSYYIEAVLYVKNNDGKKLYEKPETLVERKVFTENNKHEIMISENIKIDYANYNEIARSFIDTYGLTADGRVIVTLYVDVKGKHAEFDKKFSNRKVVSMDIPLTSRTTNIKLDYELSNSKDEILQYRSAAINNKVMFIVAIVCAVLDVLAIAGIVIYIVLTRDNDVLYRKKLDKILRDYSRYISETAITERVEDMMKTRSLRIEIIKSFEDLLDIRDNLGKPILYHEERPGEEAIFYIITDRIGYIYVMRASEIKNVKIS